MGVVLSVYFDCILVEETNNIASFHPGLNATLFVRRTETFGSFFLIYFFIPRGESKKKLMETEKEAKSLI
jgi:hypothetical protein